MSLRILRPRSPYVAIFAHCEVRTGWSGDSFELIGKDLRNCLLTSRSSAGAMIPICAFSCSSSIQFALHSAPVDVRFLSKYPERTYPDRR